MYFSLDVLRARKGDCLMLHYGDKRDPHLMMIDGGPRGVYRPYLKPRIERVKTARRLGKNQPLPIDVLLVSHVDDDHIQGILDLTREMIEAQMDRKPPLLQVISFWHNSFENIIGSSPTKLTGLISAKFGEASLAGDFTDDLFINADDTAENPETVLSTLKVLSSVEQGARLRSDAKKLGFPPNPEFGGKLIMAGQKGETIDMGHDLRFTIAGPTAPELKTLHAKHQAWLKELEKKGTSPEEALAAYIDKSVTNLSSIVLLAEFKRKRMLLTGDARGDKILQGLELVGLLRPRDAMHVDVLKVPHHGSANNVDCDFFARITADHYVFSGDGEHGNPERESFQMLWDARGDEDYEIHLTYPVNDIDAERKKDWQKEQDKEKRRKEKNPSQRVRADWSPAEHSLAALFKKNESLEKKVRAVADEGPHVIDLLGKLGY
jgi:hypothetical protein